MESSNRPQNLRDKTMGSSTISTNGSLTDFKRMSFSMNSRNVFGANQVRPDLLCALCQAILTEPWECKECHNRFHQVCLNKFAKETGQCPMMCAKPKFISVKKEVEKQLNEMQFICSNQQLGCPQILSYQQVQTHDQECQFASVKCEAYKKCKTKCIRKDIDKHQAVCPHVEVPCIYCREKVERMNIMAHEAEGCTGTYTCQKCGMSIVKEETQKNSHNCFNAMAGYLQNMLNSKDYVIQTFKEEISRKNQLIEQLLDKQDQLEQKLINMEQVLSYNEEYSASRPQSAVPQQQLPSQKPLSEVTQPFLKSTTQLDEN